MRLLGLLIFLLGAILLWFTTVPSGIGWALIIIGAFVIIGGYILKSKAS